MKHKTRLLFTYILLTISIFIAVFFSKDYIISFFYKDSLKQQLQNMQFLTVEEKNTAQNMFNQNNNKVSVVNKYENINNQYKSFTKNQNVLINPSALKSIGTYKPNLIDLKNVDVNILTKNAMNQNQVQIAKVVLPDLKNMISSAKKSNINLKINSAYRSFNEQIEIQKQLPNFAAQAGQSEHQTGLAIDFNQDNYELFKDAPGFNWLKENAYKFGFILSFSENNSKLTGENYEQWHWRYITPRYSQIFQTLKQKYPALTYIDFITKLFGYKYITNKIYNNISELVKDNQLSNIVVLKNQHKLSQFGADNINTNLQIISEKLKTVSLNNINYEVGEQFKTSDNIESNFKFNDNEIPKLFNDTVKPTIVNTIVKENLNNYKNTSLIQMCNLNNFWYQQNKSYNLDNLLGSVTYFYNKQLTSVVYLKNKGCIAINKNLENLNSHELLKQRNLIYQLQNLNSI